MRNTSRWIALALCALLFLSCLSPALADFGDFDSDGDYDSGGDYGGSDYGDSDYGGRGSSRGGNIFSVIIVGLMFLLAAIRKAVEWIRAKVSRLRYKLKMKNLSSLTRLDPDFDLEKLREWVRSLYTRMQAEWEAGDISGVKEEFTEDCWDRFDEQLQRKTVSGQQGHVRNIVFQGIDFLGWFDDGATTYLDLSLRTKIISWNTTKDGKIINGSQEVPKDMGYVWRLERPAGARSASGNDRCASCGAEVPPLMPKCQKCGHPHARSADAWRLSSIDGQRVT